MQGWLAEEEVKKGGDVGLNDEEENFLCWYSKECRAQDDIGRVGPDAGFDQVRVPWCGGNDSNL